MKSSVKILLLMKENPFITIPALAMELGRTTRAIEKQIARLQENRRLKRVGPDKGGHWEVAGDTQ